MLVEFGATKVICTATVEDKVPTFLKGQALGLGHGRVRHAAALDQHPHEPREPRPERPLAGDPAPGRTDAARGDRSRQARRAHGVGGLRRHPGRRGHAHRRDHRQLRGRGRRIARIAGAGRLTACCGTRGRDQRRHGGRRAGARSQLRGGLDGRGRHERRDDGQRASSSRCRAPPSRSRSPKPPRRAPGARRARHPPPRGAPAASARGPCRAHLQV